MRSILFTVLLAALFCLASSGPSPAQPNKKDIEEKRSKEVLAGKNMDEWIDELKTTTDPSIRESAIAMVKYYGKAAAERGAPYIIKAMSDTDASVRVNAVITLGFVGMEEKDRIAGLNALIRGLRDNEGIVRFQSARSLGRLGVDVLGSADGPYSAVLPLLRSLKDQTSSETRVAAAHALSMVSWGSEGPDSRAIQGLIDSLLSPSEHASSVRMQSIISLIMLSYDKRYVKPQLLMAEKNCYLRLANGRQADRVIIWAHVGLTSLSGRSEQDVTAIAKYLKSKSPDTRENSARALATLVFLRVDLTAHVDELTAALKDKHPPVVIWACVALGRIGGDARSSLIALKELEESPNPDVKAAAKEAIDGVTMKIKRNDEPVLQRRVPKADAPMKK
jgi:HEAT repeat protein